MVMILVTLAVCNALNFESLDLDSSTGMQTTSAQWSGQVRMSMWWDQRECHKSKKRVCLFVGGLCLRLKGNLLAAILNLG